MHWQLVALNELQLLLFPACDIAAVTAFVAMPSCWKVLSTKIVVLAKVPHVSFQEFSKPCWDKHASTKANMLSSEYSQYKLRGSSIRMFSILHGNTCFVQMSFCGEYWQCRGFNICIGTELTNLPWVKLLHVWLGVRWWLGSDVILRFSWICYF